MIKRLVKHNHNYFPQEDVKYSLRSVKGASKKTRLEKFSYPSGAVYKGEWLGGFRHGTGSMTWPDGAQYQGSWSFGFPLGFGKFTHTDGDSYSGEWKSLFAGFNTPLVQKTFEEVKNSLKDGYRIF
jgi:hypothetical protein